MGFRRNSLNQKKENQAGQAIIEYVLLLSMVAGISIFLARKLTDLGDGMTARSGAKIEKMLRTGSASASIWRK